MAPGSRSERDTNMKLRQDICATVIRPGKFSLYSAQLPVYCDHRRSKHTDKGCKKCTCQGFTEESR